MGNVVIHYQDITIRADQVSVDLAGKIVEAQGNVIVDQGPSRITGATARFDLTTKLGTITQASAAMEGDFFFTGDSVTKTSETTYVIEDGIFTACEGEVPPWSFRVRHAEVELDGYARIKGASMRVKSAPVFYLPYMLWPTKADRSSGLLVPKIGNSNDRGVYLGLAYYHVFGRSYDSTLYMDLWSRDYYGLGAEFRYQPSAETEGILQAYSIWDPVSDDQRWKVLWDHQTSNLPFGLRGVLHYEDYSDFTFFRDFERRLDDKSKNAVYSSGFVSGSWGNHSVNLLVDRRQNFSNNRSVELSQLPELQYRLRSTRLGSLPLYLALDTSANYFSVDRSESYQGEYSRLDLSPSLKMPLSSWPWLSASLTFGERLTWYGDSVVESTLGPTSFTGESLSRSVPFANAEIVGPSFSRVFDGGIGSFAKLKHIIEPRFDYRYAEEFEEQNEVPLFDEIDSPRTGHEGRVALINRLLGKPGPSADKVVGGEALIAGDPGLEAHLTAQRVAELEAAEAQLVFEDVEGIREVAGDVTPPVRIETPAPEYTQAARDAGLEGLVVVKAIIDATGFVRQPQIVQGLDADLDAVVLDTMSRWRFEPATLDGTPVPVYYQLVSRFSLTASASDSASREIASFEVSRAYSFDSARPLESSPEEDSAWGPWRATLRAYPGSRFGLRLDTDYSGLFTQVTSVRLTGNVGLGRSNRIDFSWSPQYRASDGETLSNQASLGFNWAIVPNRLALRSAINYDIERELLRDMRHFLTYQGSCYTLRLEYHESKTVSTTRRDYLFSVDLKNVGTFLDLNGGESKGF
jgi:TonB family protein